MTGGTLTEKIGEIRLKNGYDKTFLVTDSNVDEILPDFLPDVPRIVIPSGEDNKNLTNLASIWERLTREGATRQSLIINLGGGMVSDTGGFAAATFKRGIDYGNISTTLLAAVDAAIGGKTGINFCGLKNEIGAFRMPVFSLPFTETFSTLPEKEMLSGYGEMLKTGLLMTKEAFHAMTEENFLDVESRDFSLYVEKCGKFKQEIVDKDPTEKGLRKILNLGHTFGHAFESLLMKKGKPVAHGIAVAHGLLASLILSRMILDFEGLLLYKFADVLKNRFPQLPTACGDIETLIQIMGHDKKNSINGQPKFVLLREIGVPVYDVEIKESVLISAFEIYQDLTR